MTEYKIADITEKAEIVDFINYVFSYSHRPHNFKAMLPKCYADHEHPGAIHHVAKQDGKIKALVANRIIDVVLGDCALKYGLIGNVSVHPYSRGEGHMKRLMKETLSEAKELGIDIMVLGGQRQRYGYFGFENAGIAYNFTVTKTNVRHCFMDVDCSDITFHTIVSMDTKEIDFAKALYEKRRFHTLRDREEFLDIMHTWNGTFNAVNKNGEMIGYIYGNFSELVLTDDTYLPEVIKAFFLQNDLTQADIKVSPFEKERAAFFFGICEDVKLNHVEMINVLNWEKVLRTFFEFKAESDNLLDGTVTFCVEDEAFEIIVQNGKPQISKTERRANALQFTHNQAQGLFFGLNSILSPKCEFKNWLPLNFWIDSPDTF